MGKQNTENFGTGHVGKHYNLSKQFQDWHTLISNEHMDEKSFWPSLSLASAEAVKPKQSELHFAGYNVKVKYKSDQRALKLKF